MKILRQFLLATVLAIATVVAWLSYHLGAFKTVDITQAKRPAMKMIYKDHTGSYHKIVSVIQEVEAWAKSQNIDCSESFGEYIDDPNLIEEIRLRSHGGCIVKDFPANLPSDYKTQEIPERDYVIAVFEGSPGIGPAKVYPKAEAFMKNHQFVMDGSVIEIYVIHSQKEMTTTYLFPVIKGL